MDTLISIGAGATEARRGPTFETPRPVRGPARGWPRLVDPARELDAEVTRLLRVRGGELAEPLLWQRPSHRRQVDAIVAQLAPIRSRLTLLSSWARESRIDSPLRLAYAITWLRLAHRRAADYGPPRRTARSRVLAVARRG